MDDGFELDLGDEPEKSKPANLAVLNGDSIGALAKQIGYEGELSIGGVEDRVRFYQRRTVESLLEVGKCLLLLKEMAQHGEFEKRVELLGFSARSAQRFMQATLKVSKSANLALLGERVKSTSAFLELVTHDDDVIENLAEMDDIDRLTASELRARVRQLEAEGSEETKRVRATLDKLSAEHEILDRDYKRLTRVKKPGEAAYDARTYEVRHESAALEYGSRIHADALEAMFEQELETGSPTVERELRLYAIGLAAGGLMERAARLYQLVQSYLHDAMPIQPSGRYQLTDDERRRLEASVTMLDANFATRRAERASEREAEAPVRPGRPKGSKNKPKAD